MLLLEDRDCGMQPTGLSARVWGGKGRGQTERFACKVDRKALRLCVSNIGRKTVTVAWSLPVYLHVYGEGKGEGKL
jgi:hypothetical protein